MQPSAPLTEVLLEQAELLGLLEGLIDEQRRALLARQQERIEAAVVRLQTLALRFRILETARVRLGGTLAVARGLPETAPTQQLVEHCNDEDLAAAFRRLQRAAGRVVRAGAIHSRFVQRSVEAGEGLRRLFDWAAGGSYTAGGDTEQGPGPRSTWESCA